MKISLTQVYAILIGLTLIVACISQISLEKLSVGLIVSLSLAKFVLVAWEFMELKNAHSFWKSVLLVYGFFIAGFFVVLLH